MDWKDRATAKKAQQFQSIPKEWLLDNLPSNEQLDVTDFPKTCGLLTPQEIIITEAHVNDILSNLSKGNWTAVEVTTAFSKRAVIAQQLVNCLTEIFITRALSRAKELDDHFKRTGTVVGPLHGLPISLKDQLCIKGVDSTMGYVAWIGEHVDKTATLADILESLGAILYVKTNVPQTLGWADTDNHIFGRTLNPFNRSLSAGGSSGGEAALLGLKGSPLGVGTDVGGSIRLPCAFTGLYGLRPSFHRIPGAGCVTSNDGQSAIALVLGPMTSSVEGVKIFMKSVLFKEPWQYDPLVTRKKWSEEEYQLSEHGNGKELCFAVLWDDGEVVPHPPIRRGLEMAKSSLIRAGHKVIDWKPTLHSQICEVAGQLMGACGKKDFEAVTSLSGEPLIESMLPGTDIPSPLVRFRPTDAQSTAYQYWAANVKQRDLRQAYWNDLRKSSALTGTGRPVDAIICPTAAHVAHPHGIFGHSGYTVVWNLLDYPGCIVPVSKVDPVLDVKEPRHSFYNDLDRDHWNLYDPAAYKNAPISVQIVGRTMEDEAVVRMSEILDQAIKAHISM